MNWSRFDKGYWLLLPLFVFVVLTIATIIENRPIDFVLDDAYITIANAELLLRGGMDSYGNAGPTGATSPVHLFLVALLSFFLDVPVASFVWLFVLAAVYAAGLWRLLMAVGRSPFLAACGTLTGLIAGLAWVNLMNGLETGMAMAVIAWAACFSQQRRDMPLAVLAGVMPFVRPELAVLALFLALSTAWRLRGEPARLIRLAVVAALVAAVLAGLAWHFTGHVFSPTAEAKSAYFDEAPANFKNRLAMAFHALTLSGIVWPLVGLALLPALRDGWVYLGYVLAFFVASAISLPVAVYHNDYRYLYPFLPLGIAGWVAVAAQIRQIIPVLALGTLCYVIAFPTVDWRYYRSAVKWNAAQEPIALWAEQNLPDGARILIHDAGYFAWHSRLVADPPRDFVLIDAVGLKTPSASRFHAEFTAPSRGRDRWKAVDQIAREGRAEYAIIANVGFWGDIETYLRDAGWSVEPVYPNPGRYQVFALQPPQ
ncbi:hypothetical protein D2T31_09240 [Sinirhodobacter populi]|uniref:Glycosyltransferase RgtA/B/C/D-like domain-containing protein n=1 Tax=Paenirhodobacter populi TaxID=2306993 RepID=A0A443KBE8_9RHOB|nr:hypothetical protein [Sinirhodobacter populi]RWR30065.1 hypothetical protein D2T31_09240 [Sinirhodobacter populi]